jgi:hypothetical protein
MINLNSVAAMGLTMTVGELIEKLQSIDADLPIVTEGCDCDGEANSIEVKEFYREPLPIGSPFKQEPAYKYVYIKRA